MPPSRTTGHLRHLRLRALLFAALVGAMPCTSRAQNAVTVLPIPPTPSLAQAPQVPTIDAPPDLSAFDGMTIGRISVVLEGNIWNDVKVPPVGSVKPGDAFTASGARRMLEELLASGLFARGRVAVQLEAVPTAPGLSFGAAPGLSFGAAPGLSFGAAPGLSFGAPAPNGPTGVLLVARVVPRKLVGRLRVDLHGARLDRDELLREADLVEGGEIVGADLDFTKRRLERFFALHGYPSAKAEISMREMDDPMRTLLFVDVTAGPARVINDRRFYVFDADPEPVLAVAQAYAVAPKNRADETALDLADGALEQLLRAKGYYRAHVSHDLVWVGTPQNDWRIVLRVRIDAGPKLVARFEGNAHFDADILRAVLALENDADRSPAHLADKLRVFYEKRGFLDIQVRTETRGQESGPAELVVFQILEHARVRVGSRSYPCLKLDAVKNLSGGGPRSPADIGTEIDSYLDEDLPGADLFVDPDPRGVSATIGSGAGQVATGARVVPLDLHPHTTYVADTYDRAAEHLQELYRNEGFLHARVGPVQVVRARCDPRSPPNRCVSMPLPYELANVCTYDPSGLPTPAQPLDSRWSCHPDPVKGIECAPAVQIVLPVRLGPRTQIWDAVFTGVRSAAERAVADAAQIPLGDAASTTKLEEARRRIVEWYKELGYYYVDVKYALEPSLDNTRARVRFDVTEGDQVVVRDIIIHGLDSTQEGVGRRRIALEVEQPYRTSDVRKTQERIATLGVFSSVTVSLSDPYVPQPRKDVLIEVVEREPQYIEVRPGFSTGEGVRGVLEYGHRNLLGDAWAITVHLQASYLPDFLILDSQVAHNYRSLSTADRIATRNTVTMSWPEMGLGPTVRAQVDGVYVRDLERDFTLFKASVLGTLVWRPLREVQLRGGPDYEHNDVHLFQAKDIATFLMDHPGNADLARLLRVPDGDSDVVAGRIVFTWDRRDNAFNAHRGTYVSAGIEQVNSYPVQNYTADTRQQYEGHFLRLTQTLAGYIPITNAITLAAELRLGEISNVAKCKLPFDTSNTPPNAYCTYPDRLFFMGGFDSMRGWLQDTFIPQEYVDEIASVANFNASQIPLRGGNLMVNPRLELRFPVHLPIEGAIFGDFGNLWNDPAYILNHRLAMRADVGAGVRVGTPVGPLVFDYGINVTRLPYEDFGAFHFAIGLF